MTPVPLLTDEILGAIPGVEVGLWLTLILAALYSRKVLKVGSVAGQAIRYGAVAVGVVGLGLALGVLEGLDVATLGDLVGGGIDLLRTGIDVALGWF